MRILMQSLITKVVVYFQSAKKKGRVLAKGPYLQIKHKKVKKNGKRRRIRRDQEEERRKNTEAEAEEDEEEGGEGEEKGE